MRCAIRVRRRARGRFLSLCGADRGARSGRVIVGLTAMETCRSGRTDFTANEGSRENGTGGSNPPVSAKVKAPDCGRGLSCCVGFRAAGRRACTRCRDLRIRARETADCAASGDIAAFRARMRAPPPRPRAPAVQKRMRAPARPPPRVRICCKPVTVVYLLQFPTVNYVDDNVQVGQLSGLRVTMAEVLPTPAVALTRRLALCTGGSTCRLAS